MKAKEYLNQIARIDTLVNNKLAELDYWMTVATGTTTCTDDERVQSSGSKQRMEDAVCRLVDIQREINAEIDRLVDLKQEVVQTIEKLSLDEYDVLHKIYVQGMTFQEVNALKGKSYSWVTTIHGRALANLQKILDKGKEKNEEGNGRLEKENC